MTVIADDAILTTHSRSQLQESPLIALSTAHKVSLKTPLIFLHENIAYRMHMMTAILCI